MAVAEWTALDSSITIGHQPWSECVLRMLAFAMPVGLTRTDVDTIAALANLDLDPSERELFARQLGDILAYADELRRVDTSNIPPTAHGAARHEPDRADLAAPSLDPMDAMANAPDAARGADGGFFFRVPRVLG